MSVTFYGTTKTTTRAGVLETWLRLDYEHPDHLNLNNGNAAALIRLLGFEDGPSGEVTMPEARRGIIRARNTSKASDYTRAPESERGRRGCRVISGGLDLDGLMSRLERFESFVDVMERMGATSIYWA